MWLLDTIMHKFIDQYYTIDGRLFRKKRNVEVGWICNKRYRVFDHDGKKYLVHRAIFLLVYGFLPNLIDHIDRDKLNNHPTNLRPSNKRMNSFNAEIRSDNTSGIRGVSFSKSNFKWFAYMWKNGKRINGGYFNSFEEAVNRRIELEKEF